MKTFDVLGITIKDYALKELLSTATDFLLTPQLKTVSWLSANVLLMVSENIEQWEWVDSLDLMICNQAGILKSGRAAMQLHKDGKSEDFIENYFKYLAISKSEIVLVCDDSEKAELLKKLCLKYNDRLNIVSTVLVEDDENYDNLFNQLNLLEPRVVLTCVPWMMQGPLTDEARRMSNARVWMSFLPEMLYENTGSKEMSREAFFDRFMFGRRVASYEKNEKSESRDT